MFSGKGKKKLKRGKDMKGVAVRERLGAED